MVAKAGSVVARGLLGMAVMRLTACRGGGSNPAASGGPAGQRYSILLERDAEPGKPYRVRIKDESTETMVMSSQGKVLNEEKKLKALSFVGTGNALAAGDHHPTEYVVDELTQLKDAQTQALLPPGTKLLKSPVDEKWQYTVDGTPVSEEAKDALETLLGSSVGAVGDDDIFGSKEPRAVGERWSINVEKMKEDDLDFDPQGAAGSTRIVAVRQVDGVECLEIEAEMTIARVDFKGIPKDAKVHESKMSGRFLGLFPTNTKLLSISQGMSMDLNIKMDVMSPNGLVQIDMDSHGEKTTNRD
jgi:hypothetical protein